MRRALGTLGCCRALLLLPHLLPPERGSHHRLRRQPCSPGSSSDGLAAAAVNVCALGAHDCEQICVSNSGGSYRCDCYEGYALNPDKRTCSAVDICAPGRHNCDQICVRNNESYVCNWYEGNTLNSDRKTCSHKS